jgi:hypothetical protein
MQTRRRGVLPLSVALALSGCVYVPRVNERYDPDCQITSRQYELQPVVMARLDHCRNEECAAALVFAGAVAATSAVVSGSIVVVGNVAYWLEKQGRCQRKS